MAEIKKKIFGNLTVIKITGTPTVEELLQTLDDLYSNKPTPDFVWDLSEGSARLLTAPNIKRLVEQVKPRMALRVGGKTAIIAPGDLEFGIGRILDTQAEIQNAPFAMHVFRNAAEAAEWLGIAALPEID